MTNSEVAKAASGAVVALTSAAASYANQVEQWSRIVASWIAIISGLVVIWSVVSKKIKNKKREKNNRRY